MFAGLILVTFSFVIGEFIGPDAEKKAKDKAEQNK
jgi:lipopolysaccharide export LptBFGC system permease protein LptF